MMPSLVQTGKTLRFLPPKSASIDSFNEFIDAIDSLTKDNNLRMQMGKNAALRVKQKHNLNLNYKVMEEKLMDILRARSLEGK